MACDTPFSGSAFPTQRTKPSSREDGDATKQRSRPGEMTSMGDRVIVSKRRRSHSLTAITR
jgi:hypothetical protein